MQKNKKNKKKLVFAGSHAGTVAFAVLEEVKRRRKNWEIHFMGPKYSFEASDLPSLETSYLKREGVIYHGVQSGKLVKKLSLRTFLTWYKLALGLVMSFKLLNKIRPQVVVSF